MRARFGIRWAGALAACAATWAWAGEANYQPYVVGERAAGMGGAVAATANGMDACFYNPAGLGRETSDSISVNGALYGIQSYETRDASFPGEDFQVSSFATIPTGLSAVRKLRAGTAAAFSVFVPSRLSYRDIQAFPEREHYYNYSQDEQTLYAGPSVGRAFGERWTIGASLFGAYQTASDLENLYWGDYSYTYTANYKYSVLGAVGVLGVQCRLTDEWAAGLAFTTPAATLFGRGRIQMSEVLGDAQVADAGAVYYDDLDADNGLPAQLRAGLGWQRPGVGGFGIDATHHWARDYDWMSGGSGDDALAIRQSRRAVTDLQVGGEYVVRQRYPLRAGAFTSFSSAPDLEPDGESTLSQIDLYGVTASIGSEGETVVMNFGVSYVWGEGDALGTRLDGAGELESIVSRTSESGLYVFASTAYRF